MCLSGIPRLPNYLCWTIISLHLWLITKYSFKARMCWINIHTLRATQGSVSCLGILGHADWSISSLSCVSGFLLASLNSPANGCTALGWRTSSQLPTLASVRSTLGQTASETTMANSFSERMRCPPYSPKDRIPQRCGLTTGSCLF